ncbi:hypothetical protein [Roseibium album]|uniref:hypothetical protein n=1 Tax=Roseibium album TaxID=311410 RepID=UPI00391CF463
MIVRILSRIFQSFTKFINNQPKWFRGFLLPVVVPLSAVLILQRADFDKFPITSYVLLFTYATLLALNAIALYQNSVLVEESQNKDKLKDVLIHNIDHFVSRRRQDLVGSIKQYGDGEISKFAESVHNEFNFEQSVARINTELFNTIREYLNMTGRLGTANLYMVLIRPNKDETFVRVGGEEKTTGNTRAMPVVTGISLNDDDALTVQLWKDRSNAIRSIPDTEEAERQGQFKFLNENERGLIKSMLCFRVNDPVTDTPFAIWRIDASDAHIFPSIDETETIKDLSKILSCFSERLTLEIAYGRIFDKLGDFYKNH